MSYDRRNTSFANQATYTLSSASLDSTATGGIFSGSALASDLVLINTGTANAPNWQAQSWVANGTLNTTDLGFTTHGEASIRYINRNPNYNNAETYIVTGKDQFGLPVNTVVKRNSTQGGTITWETTPAAFSLDPISGNGWLGIEESRQDLRISGIADSVPDGLQLSISLGALTDALTSSYTATVSKGEFAYTIPAGTFPWLDGTSYQVSASDIAPSGSSLVNSRLVNVDLTPPSFDLGIAIGSAPPVAIDQNIQGEVNTANVVNAADFISGVSLVVNSSNDTSQVHTTINGIDQEAATAPSNGGTTWSTPIDPSTHSLPVKGSVNLSVSVTDQAGNSSSQNTFFTVDREIFAGNDSVTDGGNGDNIPNTNKTSSVVIEGGASSAENGANIDSAPAATNFQPSDDDDDGLREVTFAADDYGVDGNRDRVLDAEQGQVAGIRLINDGARYSDYGALVVSGDVALRGVTLLPAAADGSVAVSLADGSTVNAALPGGLTNTFAGSLAFELSGLTPGGSTEALIYLPVGYSGDGSAYVRYNYASGLFEDYRDAEGKRLYAFTDTDGDGFGDAITLTLTDGDAQWDGDGLANGSVLDPGFLASGAIEITGDGQDNRLSGNILANQIRGKGKSDVLIGDLGDDILRGGKGNDRFNGGEGSDIVIGGLGADRFRYSALIDSTAEHSDTIQFNQRDQIDLRRLDANAMRQGNQAFSFVADAKFTGQAGELRLFESRLLADVDGDRKADFGINLRSNQAFSTDFLLL